MIATQDSTPDTMKWAIAYTLAALHAAAEIDRDRTDDDRAFFRAECAALEPLGQRVTDSAAAVERHEYSEGVRAQVRVEVGDAVLDRGVRDAKSRMKVELKTSSMPGGEDHVFPVNVRDITDAAKSAEPGLVRQAVARFGQVPEFHGKAAMRDDLAARARTQQDNLDAREASDLDVTTLKAALRLAIRDSADALYRLEKRMLERFPRDTTYVRKFFYDVAAPRTSKKTAAPVPSPAPTPRSSQNPPPA